jgi:hypothetical protein
MVVQPEIRRATQPLEPRKEVVGGPFTRIWAKVLGVYGIVGEFLAHGVFLAKTAFPACGPTDWLCATGIPSIRDNPWLTYHVSVHFVLGFAVVLMILPEKWKVYLKVVSK